MPEASKKPTDPTLWQKLREDPARVARLYIAWKLRNDPLSVFSASIMAGGILLLRPFVVGRWTVATAALFAALTLFAIGIKIVNNWRRYVLVNSLAFAAGAVVLAAIWHGHGWWHLAPWVLAVVLARIAEPKDGLAYRQREFDAGMKALPEAASGGERSAALRKIDKGIGVVREIVWTISSGAEIGEPYEQAGAIHVEINSPVPLPVKGDRTIQWFIANKLNFPTTAVRCYDLGAVGKAGKYDLVFGEERPEFDFEMPAIPPREKWPAGELPLGVDRDGNTVWLAVKTMDHVLISGRTRWGKSNSIWIIVIGLIRAVRHVEFVMIDPKGGAELGMWAPWCSDFAETPAQGKELLRRLVVRMEDRYRSMKRAGQRKSTMWPIVCVIDEAAQVLDDKEARALSLKLAQMALAANIHIIYATQYPTDDLFGSALKQNISTVITHRLKDATGSNVALGAGAKGDGWDASKLEKPGRAIVEMPHLVESRIKVQVFRSPDEVPDDLPRPAVLPVGPESGKSGAGPSEGPYAGTLLPDQPDIRQIRSGESGESGEDLSAEVDALIIALDERRPNRDRVLAMLGNEVPVTGRAIAETLRITPQSVSEMLGKLVSEGVARKVKGGWMRAA